MAAFANIREHMQVFGSDGTLVGIVDHMEGKNRIKLTKGDSADGQHHFIDAGLVDHVDVHVHLSKPAGEVMSTWEDELELEDDDAGMADIEESTAQKQKEWLERRR